jgi:hypothetical protein
LKLIKYRKQIGSIFRKTLFDFNELLTTRPKKGGIDAIKNQTEDFFEAKSIGEGFLCDGMVKRSRPSHRNLRSRTSILQIFWRKEHLVYNRLISTLDKVIYFKETIFLQSTKPLFIAQK